VRDILLASHRPPAGTETQVLLESCWAAGDLMNPLFSIAKGEPMHAGQMEVC
jgi:hypothetical protein